MKIKIAFLDWYNTLVDEQTLDFLPGALDFLRFLQQNEIKIYIITAVPGENPSDEIYNKLQDLQPNRVPKKNIIWVGMEKYQGPQEAAYAKALKIIKICEKEAVDKS